MVDRDQLVLDLPRCRRALLANEDVGVVSICIQEPHVEQHNLVHLVERKLVWREVAHDVIMANKLLQRPDFEVMRSAITIFEHRVPRLDKRCRRHACEMVL
jgi:hypothetical protein